MRGDREGLLRVDETLHALKVAEELRSASMQMGKARWNVLKSLSPENSLIAWCDDAIHRGRFRAHNACVSGIQNACLGISREDGAVALAYQGMSGAVSVGMRLLRFGQDTAQRMIFRLGGMVPGLVREASRMALEDLGSSTPVLDIASMRHQRADRRLFLS